MSLLGRSTDTLWRLLVIAGLVVCAWGSVAVPELLKLRIVLDGKPAPVTSHARYDGKELFLSLDILELLGCKVTLSRREESALVRTPDGAERELALTRIAGAAMVPANDVEALLDVKCAVNKDVCEITTAAFRKAAATPETSVRPQKADAPDTPVASSRMSPTKPTDQKTEPPLRDGSNAKPGPTAAEKPKEEAAKPARAETVQQPDKVDNGGAEGAAQPGADPRDRTVPLVASRAGTAVGPRQTRARVRDVVCEALDPAQARLRILADGAISPRVSMAHDRPALIVDIPGAELESPTASWVFAHPLVSGVEALKDAAPNVLRLLINLSRLVTFRTRPAPPDGYEIAVRLPGLTGRRINELTVVIDPGHGGPSATGCSAVHEGQRVYEKNLTLSMARKVRERLTRLGIHAVLTRTDDSAVSLAARPQQANDLGADLFLSIHVDYAPSNSNASGTTAYYHGSNENGRALAYVLARSVSAAGGLPNRGARSDLERFVTGMAVLRRAEMPAVLLEVAFLSNPNDRAKLISGEFQDKVADAIAEGIKAYVLARIPGLEPVAEQVQ